MRLAPYLDLRRPIGFPSVWRAEDPRLHPEIARYLERIAIAAGPGLAAARYRTALDRAAAAGTTGRRLPGPPTGEPSSADG